MRGANSVCLNAKGDAHYADHDYTRLIQSRSQVLSILVLFILVVCRSSNRHQVFFSPDPQGDECLPGLEYVQRAKQHALSSDMHNWYGMQ